MTIQPQLVNISPYKIIFTPNYADLRDLSSIVVSRIFTLFVIKSTSIPKLEVEGNSKILRTPVRGVSVPRFGCFFGKSPNGL